MNPVFIGGCDRSGTTLLGAILGTHPNIVCIPESQFKTDVYFTLKKEKDENNLLKAFNMIISHWRFKIWELDISLPIKYIESPNFTYPKLIEYIVKQYANKVCKRNPTIWIDHTPSNLKYAITLNNLFNNNAKFIHIVRDGRGVASSIIPLDWGPNNIIKAAYWWTERVAYGLAAESFLGNDKIIRVRYEDLVINPSVTIKQLCSFLNIDYHYEMIKGYGFNVPRFTKEQHLLVGKPPNSSRANVWEKKLSSRKIEIFEYLTGDFLCYLGYELKFGNKSKPPLKFEKLIYEIYEIYRKLIANRILISRRKKKSLSLK